MDYCRYIRLKITPTNQEFVSDETDEIIIAGLQKISINYHFRLVAGLDGLHYYECVVEAGFAQFSDSRYYRWLIENEINVQHGFPALVKANKINLAEFVRLSAAAPPG